MVYGCYKEQVVLHIKNSISELHVYRNCVHKKS